MKPLPPIAKQVPKTLSIHGDGREDEYYWIRDDSRSDPEVLDLLAQENAYTTQMMAHSQPLQNKLFDEISNRLPSEDRTVPVRDGQYQYFQEYHEGGEYPVYLRAPVDDIEKTRVLLDVNKLSEGHEFYHVGNWSVSPNEQILAYADDTLSRRLYSLHFKNLATGELLADEITGVSPSIAWAADNKTVFYVRKNPQTLLPYQVFRHRLGTRTSQDQLVYEETDNEFYTSVYTSRSHEFIVIKVEKTDSSEVRLIPATQPEAEPTIFLAREQGHEYRIRHANGTFYILTNWRAKNFRLMKVADDKLGDKSQWQEVIAHRDNVLLQDMEVFTDYLVVNEKIAGLPQFRVMSVKTGESKIVDFPEPAYMASLASNPEVNTDQLRYSYSSLTRPDSEFEYDMATGVSKLLKEEQVLGGFDRHQYQSFRKMFTARDGVKVPVSFVYRTDKFKPGENPLFVYAYGSYGYATDPGFISKRLSLLDRGFVYAIIHVRGGDEMGRGWYEDGKLLHKKNTFNDFIDGTRFMIDENLVDADNVFAAGGSAGGLLMGVVANQAPELYKGIIASVPFVDVVTTMLDESIPLTTGEFEEWGNPKDKRYYDYMLSYSPYDQVKEQNYPNMFVTTGLYDSQVQYYEPVKWVSRIRRLKTDDNLLLLDIDMDTGHGGSSGRYERHKLAAKEYAFILDLAQRDQ